MKKLIVLSAILWLAVLAGCTNNTKELDLLKAQNALLQQQIDQQSDSLNQQINQQQEYDQTEVFRKECVVLQEKAVKDVTDFLNKCTNQEWNSSDFCFNSPAFKFLNDKIEDFIINCIEDKKNLKY